MDAQSWMRVLSVRVLSMRVLFVPPSVPPLPPPLSLTTCFSMDSETWWACFVGWKGLRARMHKCIRARCDMHVRARVWTLAWVMHALACVLHARPCACVDTWACAVHDHHLCVCALLGCQPKL